MLYIEVNIQVPPVIILHIELSKKAIRLIKVILGSSTHIKPGTRHVLWLET